MNKDKPFILITNDDGVEADGIAQLAKAFRDVGTVVVFAPDSARSGMSCAITTTEPVRYQLLGEVKGVTIYSCTGTPVDCVKLALNEVLPVRPDLLVSGINHGGNQGLSIHYSATMGAAFEGCVFDIPSFGVSLCDYYSGADFSASCSLARSLAEQVLKKGLPRSVYLNMNIPNTPHVKGIAIGRQTAGKWVHEYDIEETNEGTQYWLTGDYEMTEPHHPDNDITLLNQGYASLVPCRIDVTDHAFREELKKWKIWVNG